jgi:penicillin-binding protein 2
MARRPKDQEVTRLILLLLLMLGLMGVVVYRVWNLQVVKEHHYAAAIEHQSIRRVRIPGLRGRIFDRNGKCLADNRPSHCIAIYPSEKGIRQRSFQKTVERVDSLIDELAAALQIDRQVNREDIDRHVREKRMLPLYAWQDLDDLAIARFAERVGYMPGVDYDTKAIRKYPYGEMACHVLGHISTGLRGREEEGRYDFYENEMDGRSGLERVYNEMLRGKAGGQLLRVDVSSYRHSVISEQMPQNGSDIQLTLDTRIQQLTERVLDTELGSICIVDPNNGHVLGLSTFPRFDLNRVRHIYDQLLKDPRQPLINRAIYEYYAPGSTFKPVVAMAALMSGKIPANQVYFCPGHFELGDSKRYCAGRVSHGNIDLRQAIERSCNVYFWQLGLETGYDYIYHMAAALGLGQRTGIELGASFEKPGILPDSAWKQARQGDRWRDGDTANVSIGQGFLNVTALQMAMVTASFANGGILYRPKLVAGIRSPGDKDFSYSEPEVANDLQWPGWAVGLVRAGMEDVVMTDRGSGRNARLAGLRMAGKTGSAQFGQPGNEKYRSWMIAFAPVEHPRFAVSLVIAEGGGSGVDAVPRMKRIMEGLFKGGDGT